MIAADPPPTVIIVSVLRLLGTGLGVGRAVGVAVGWGVGVAVGLGVGVAVGFGVEVGT
jgi:VIT1/CCC1 family predicted Fe2+/Mn2+ transporter